MCDDVSISSAASEPVVGLDFIMKIRAAGAFINREAAPFLSRFVRRGRRFDLQLATGDGLLLSPHSPERTDPKPSKRQRECHRGHNMPSACLSGMKFRVFTKKTERAKARHG